MTNREFYEAIFGAVLPPFIDILNRRVKDSRLRFVVSMLVCLASGALINIDQLNLENFLESGTLIFASAQTIYHTYWKTSRLRRR